MKNLFYALFFVLFACTSPNTTPDMTLYNANLEIVKKALACYETPQDFETFKSLICESVKHQSPMYGQGVVDYDGVMGQAQFYMNGFSNVKFENAKWLPGVDTQKFWAKIMPLLTPSLSIKIRGLSFVIPFTFCLKIISGLLIPLILR